MDLAAQFFDKINRLPAPSFPIIQCPLRDVTTKHILQTHGLGTKLKHIGVVFFWPSPFIFHREGLPDTFFSGKGNSDNTAMELYNIALAG